MEKWDVYGRRGRLSCVRVSTFHRTKLDLRNLHKESHRGGAWCSVARWEIGICINEESSSGGLFVLDLVEDVLGCIDGPEMGLEAYEQADEATYQER